MASATFPTTLGGDGSTVTDDANASTGLANGGHRTRFVPALAQMVACANGGVTQSEAAVTAAEAARDLAQTYASNASTSATSAINSPGSQGTSTSSILIGTGSKTLTLAQTGKSFLVGQYVQIVNTADTTRWLLGAITAFTAGTGAMTVNVVMVSGSGTYSAWAVSQATPPTPALNPSPVPTIVVLTSGTSWTVPAGVTKAEVIIIGGGGGGGGNAEAAGGGSGGVVVDIMTLTPGAAVSYSIGGGGTAGSGGTNGGAGGTTTFNAISAGGGGGGNGTATWGRTAGGTASGGDINIVGGTGWSTALNGSAFDPSIGGSTPLGLGVGGVYINGATAGTGYGFGGCCLQAGGAGAVIIQY